MCQLFPIIFGGINRLVISTARNRLLMFNAWQRQIGYWRALQDGTKSIKERKKISLELIKQLEETPIIEQFYSEFSRCVNVERSISEIEEYPS